MIGHCLIQLNNLCSCENYDVRILKNSQRGMSEVYWMKNTLYGPAEPSSAGRITIWVKPQQSSFKSEPFSEPEITRHPDRIWMTTLSPNFTEQQFTCTFKWPLANNTILIIHNLSFWMQRCMWFIKTVWQFIFVCSWVRGCLLYSCILNLHSVICLLTCICQHIRNPQPYIFLFSV